jgi:hypothetical protein
MRDGRGLDELEIELGIVLILVSSPEAVISKWVVPGLVARRAAGGCRPTPRRLAFTRAIARARTLACNFRRSMSLWLCAR